ncbi:hypothetical protein LGM85_25260 [Burkholderia multivorans]|uniref:hypothetical protein n=1 Tax=Burkholderia multivorans TaxID=87883 RepID=UPI0020199777|nr:hypothetical protein [Burkholderia multivorans]MCA8487253.1 hypothetical protein [Burkholderia multivorans]MCL4663311.1 hypothetical protein [Burkholderia multivorans]MCO1356815.1 hypothetical protein [Burkholderia multivorans]MCO1414977.1 hypothetical protein [Burkholderia multivorans]MCO1448920.1 hypothetical protein [Burkholderia multivorans]
MEHENNNLQQEFDEIARRLDLKIETQFVPFSISRNADAKHKSLNWKITLSSIRNKMTFDYCKGVGHLPYPSELQLSKHQRAVVDQAIDAAVETGVARKIARGAMAFTIMPGKEEFPAPTLQEVLHALTEDTLVMHYLTYEEWAADFGYDPDSRKGEKVYEECRLQVSKLSDVLGDPDKIENLRGILQDLESRPTSHHIKPRI